MCCIVGYAALEHMIPGAKFPISAFANCLESRVVEEDKANVVDSSVLVVGGQAQILTINLVEVHRFAVLLENAECNIGSASLVGLENQVFAGYFHFRHRLRDELE